MNSLSISYSNPAGMAGRREWGIHLLITILLLAFFNLNLSAQDKSPGNEEPVAVKALFKVIQEKTGYRFFYSDDLIDLDKRITLETRGKTIDEIIRQLKEKTSLDFRILENQLIVVMPDGMAQQSLIVRGKVTSADEPNGMPGVNVFVKGTTRGTITDTNGEYILEVPNKYDVLVYSFVGFENAEVPISARENIDVELTTSVKQIDEVVITALNISRDKTSLGYSVTQINSEEIDQARENNPINSLAGKVSGLQITKAPTGVDGSSRVVLRGIASLLGNNRPLFVIDGIPMDAGYGSGGRWGGKDSGDALSDLNPGDIASMSVLKGAGASALYGSRGANGVILITTKRGKQRKGIGVSFTSAYSMETPMVKPDLQNEYGQGAFGLFPTLSGTPPAPQKDYPWIWSYGPKMDGTVRPDWTGRETPFISQPNPYDDFFRTGSSFINTISFDGGNQNTSFRASITNQDSKGIMPNNSLSRQTLNLRGFSKMGETVEFDGKLTYIHSKVNNQPYLAEDGRNIVQSLNIMPRSISLESIKNNIADAQGNEMKWNSDNTFSNPYWILKNVQNRDEKHRLQAMFSAKWNFLPDFNLLVRSGFDFTTRNNRDWENPGRPSIKSGQGSMSQSLGHGIEWNSDFLLSYAKSLNDFNLNLSGGGNYRYDQSKSLSQSGSVVQVPGLIHISNYKNYSTGEGFYEKEVYSLYGLGQFSYKNYLYLDVTARNDWSSTLPLQNNSYFYHSENLSFLFTEAFGLKGDILNSGKLRASFAKVGNDTGPYQIDQYYYLSQSQLPYPLASMGGQLPHFDLQPEETSSWEAGTNLSLLNHRLNIDATYYYSLSDNQIMPVQLTPSSGYTTKMMNAGKIQNTGFEAQINATPFTATEGLSWEVVLTWSKNKSLVKELYGDMEYLPLAAEFYMTMEARPGEPYGIIYTLDYKRDAFGNKLIDGNGFAQPGERKAMGDINPNWMGGIANQLNYKNFNLSFLIDMQMGGDIYSWGKAYRALFGTSRETLEGRAEWNATLDPGYQGEPGGYIETGIKESNGRPNDIPIDPTYRWYNIYNSQIGTEWIQDATNVRLREVVLGYSLPERWLTSSPIAHLKISLVGRNLLFLYRAMEHADPEAGYSSGNTGNGIEHLSLPSTSSYGVNLQLSF